MKSFHMCITANAPQNETYALSYIAIYADIQTFNFHL